MGLNRRTDRVVMKYDKDRYGIVVSVSQFDGEWSVSFWMDLRTGGIFPDEYAEAHTPTSLLYFNSRVKSERTLLAGCNDGYIRRWNETEKSDDGSTVIESEALIGPIVGSNTRSRVGVNEVSIKTGVDTDALSVSLYSGLTAEHLIDNVVNGEPPKVTKSFTTDKLLPSIRQQVKGGAIGVKLSNNSAASTWSMEKIDIELSESGRMK
jgi:hypothetical protein